MSANNQNGGVHQEAKAGPVDFKLERYKYILNEIHLLNKSLHKYLALFQTLATAIVGAGVAVFVSARKVDVSAEVARASIYALLGLLILLAVFVIFSVLAGIFSWRDYRNEEVALLDDVVGSGFRSRPKLRNFWRWYETHVIVFVIIFVIAACWFVRSQVIPQIKPATDPVKVEQAK